MSEPTSTKTRHGSTLAAERRRAMLLEAELAEPRNDRLARKMIWVAVMGVLGFLLWASIAEIDTVVVAEGELLPPGGLREVQDDVGGRVLDVLVSEGQTVVAGDPLIRFDRSEDRASLRQLRIRRAALKSELEREVAIAAGNDVGTAGSMTFDGQDPLHDAVLKAQTETRETRLNVLRADEELAQARLEEARELQTQYRQREGILARRLEDLDRLSASGTVSRQSRDETELRLIETRVDLVEAQRLMRSAMLDLERARNSTSEFVARERSEALAAAARIEADIAGLDEEILRYERRVASQTVFAPATGRVQSLAVTGDAQVVPPGGLIVELVEDDGSLIAELRVPASEIGSITSGTEVVIKVLTFDHTRFGGIDGAVSSVSPTSFTAENGQSYYAVEVVLDADFVGAEAMGLSLRSGLAVVGDIQFGRHTILHYFLRPLRAIGDRAFQEA